MRRALASVLLALSTACGGGTAAAPTEATAPSTPVPAIAKPSVSAVASPSAAALPNPTATSAPAAKPQTVYVGNTDGDGVFVRQTAVMGDRLRAYPDGTELTIIGDDVDGDGQHWHHVKTPDGLEGFVPAMYTVEAPP